MDQGITAGLTAEDIKRIRSKYQLSQKAFADVLGIGVATIARYEKGQKPTRAMENLIRAAERPAFMLDCLARSAESIAPKQRERVEKIIYAEITLNEKGDIMGMNEIYELTLQQEILNEQAAEMLGSLSRMRREAEEAGNDVLAMVYEDAIKQLYWAKDAATDAETQAEIAEARGRIVCIGELLNSSFAKVA